MTHIVHTGNSLEVMQGMQSGSVDCVIVDPPYLGFGLVNNTADAYWEGFLPFYNEMDRLCNDDKRLAISAPKNKIRSFFDHIDGTDVMVINDAYEIKRGEDALFILKNPILDIKNEHDISVIVKEEFPAHIISKSSHPNARDVSKMAAVVKAMSNKGDTILDPFCGSAAIGVACVLLGRKFIGIELSEDRSADACVRLNHAEDYLKNKIETYKAF